MTTLNAFGFFLLGLGMTFLPALAPGFFVAQATDGSNTSELWLVAMGTLQVMMGVSFIIRNEAAPLAVRLMALRLPAFKPVERVVPALILRPLRGGYVGGRSSGNQRLAA